MKKQIRQSSREKIRVLLFTVLVAVCVISMNLLAEKIGAQLDLSYNRLSTLSETTEQLLDQLSERVTLYVMRVDGMADNQVESVAEQYARRSSLIDLQYINPDEEPALLRRVNPNGETISAGAVAVCSADGSRWKLIPVDDFTLYGVQSYNGEDYTYRAGYQYEKQLDMAILSVTEEKQETVVLLQGHGELTMAESAAMIEALENSGLSVSSRDGAFDLTDAAGSVIVLLSPTKDITEDEMASLRQYMDAGGGVLVVQDPGACADKPVLDRLLAFYGVQYENGVVVANPEQTDAYYPGNPSILVADWGEHEIMSRLADAGAGTILAPQCAPVQPVGMERNEMQRSVLLRSQRGAYSAELSDPNRTSIQQLDSDEVGTFPVAMAVEHVRSFEGDKPNGRLVALGGSGLVNQSAINRSYSNAEFLLGAVRWLLQSEDTVVDVRFKTAQREALQIPSQQTAYTLAGVLVAIGLILCLTGLIICGRRKNL